MVSAATRDTDFWLLAAIFVLSAVVIAYQLPRVIGFVLLMLFRSAGIVRRRVNREQT